MSSFISRVMVDWKLRVERVVGECTDFNEHQRRFVTGMPCVAVRPPEREQELQRERSIEQRGRLVSAV